MGAESRGDLETAAARPFGLDLSLAVFDRATRLAMTLFGALDARIVLVKDGHLWRSRDPLGHMAPRDPAAQVVLDTGELLWIEDTREHPLVAQDPLVAGPPYLRFYAGAPICLEDGSTPGVLCVASQTPRPFDRTLAARLGDLADFVADEWSRAQARRAREASARERDEARSALHTAVGAIPISLVLTDREMRVVAASPRWIREMNLIDREIVGVSLYDLHPRFFGRWRNVYDR
jgi:GAF domain-containing protein